jgi:dolichol-phosphate mannosyltransferase
MEATLPSSPLEYVQKGQARKALGNLAATAIPQRTLNWPVAILLVMAVRFAIAALMPISPEEAYHWNFARHLDWSYYDHPPMVAWAIALGRLVLGDTALGVRLAPLLFSLGTAIVLARLARRFYGEQAATWAVFLLALEPCVSVIGGWGFPDSPLLFFWSLTLAFVWHAIDDNRRPWWLLAGAALGAGMLSKYTAAFLVPSLLCYLLFSRRDRRWLATPWPYLAGLVSLVVFLPVLYWNWLHHWGSFQFQSTARFQAANDFSLRAGGIFLGEQWLGILPLTLPLGVIAFWRGARSCRLEERFLFWMFLPMFGFFGMFGFTPSYHLLWGLPAYLALTVLMAGVLARGENRLAQLFAANWKPMVAVASVMVVIMVFHASCVIPGIPPLRETYGWDEAAARAKAERDRLPPGSFYLAIGNRSYPFPSQLAFHLNAPNEVHATNLLNVDGLQYRFWENPGQLVGRDAVIVLEAGANRPWILRILETYFQSIESAGELVVPVGKFPVAAKRKVRFLFYRGHGYHGLEAKNDRD